MPRDETDAQPGHDRLFDRLVAAHFHIDLGHDGLLAEEFLHRRARSGSDFAHDHRFVGDILDRDPRPPDERMSGGGDQHEGMRRDVDGLGVHIGGRTAHDRQIDFV